MTVSRIFSWLAVLLVTILAAGDAHAAGLQSHRALYAVKLVKIQPGASIVSGQGVMSYQIEKSCDGWITGQTWKMTMNTVDGASLNQDIRFAAWESFDGKSVRFSLREQHGNKTGTTKGRATLNGKNGAGEVIYKKPKPKKIKLPSGTVFPIAQVIELLEKAGLGETLVAQEVFDGSSKKGLLRIATFISKKRSHKSVKMPIKHDLLRQSGWTMRSAIFPAKGRAPAPEYEVEMFQLENGIIPTATQEFPDSSIEMKLKKLEALKPPKCS